MKIFTSNYKFPTQELHILNGWKSIFGDGFGRLRPNGRLIFTGKIYACLMSRKPETIARFVHTGEEKHFEEIILRKSDYI